MNEKKRGFLTSRACRQRKKGCYSKEVFLWFGYRSISKWPNSCESSVKLTITSDASLSKSVRDNISPYSCFLVPRAIFRVFPPSTILILGISFTGLILIPRVTRCRERNESGNVKPDLLFNSISSIMESSVFSDPSLMYDTYSHWRNIKKWSRVNELTSPSLWPLFDA